MSDCKRCAIIGHRDCVPTEELYGRVRDVARKLIEECDVTRFLFGSKSGFNDLCHNVVTELKTKFPFLERVKYTCASEGCILENDRAGMEEAYAITTGKQIKFLGFEGEVEHKSKYVAGVASYIERNYAMIDDADFVVFYYDEASIMNVGSVKYGSYKSGTKIAFDYARRKKKKIINLFIKKD